jgi:hypothetical protein
MSQGEQLLEPAGGQGAGLGQQLAGGTSSGDRLAAPASAASRPISRAATGADGHFDLLPRALGGGGDASHAMSGEGDDAAGQVYAQTCVITGTGLYYDRNLKANARAD